MKERETVLMALRAVIATILAGTKEDFEQLRILEQVKEVAGLAKKANITDAEIHAIVSGVRAELKLPPAEDEAEIRKCFGQIVAPVVGRGFQLVRKPVEPDFVVVEPDEEPII